jgi:site-specific DNA recombinase
MTGPLRDTHVPKGPCHDTRTCITSLTATSARRRAKPAKRATTSTSSSPTSRKARPDSTPTHSGLWESSRGSRKVGEWVDLLDLLTAVGKTVWVHGHSRLYDPRNARDRRTLLEDAVDSEYEVAKSSDRILRTTRNNAAEGRPHGQAPFGYIRVYNERTRALIGQEPHLRRRLWSRKCSTGSSKGTLSPRSRRTSRHAAFETAPESRTDKRICGSGRSTRPTQAGASTRRRCGARRLEPGVTGIDAIWEPLVSRGDFLAVQEILSNPSRKTGSRPGRARHLVSMIARSRTVWERHGCPHSPGQRGIQVPEAWVRHRR